MADKFQLKALITGVDKLSPTLAGIRKNVAGFRKQLEKTGLGKIGFSDIVQGGAFAAPFVAGINEAVKFESAMADVKKVVNFDTPEQFKQMSKDVLDLSEALPMTAEGIAQIVAAGGQASIPRAELKAFATDAVKMGIAFDQTAEQSGDMMAKWRTSFKLTQPEVVALADKINYLSNNGPATAQQISDIVTRIGPLGEIAGLASGQIAAMGATLAGVGVPSEVAATGMKNFMLTLTKGAAATKQQQQAFKALRLDTKKVAVSMQKDAQGTIEDVLARIAKVDPSKQSAILTELFGTESVGAIAPMLTNLELLRKNFRSAGDASQYTGSMEQEYASRSATTANAMQLLRNRITSVGISLGTIFLPALNEALATIGPMISQVGAFAEANPFLVKGLLGAAIGFTVLRVAVMSATVATKIFSAVASMSPVGLIVRGIALAAGLLIANWSTVAPYFTALWEKIRGPAMALWDWFKKVFAWTPLGMIIQNWEPLTGFFSALWDVVVALAAKGWDFLKTAVGFGPLGIITSNWEPIVAWFKGMYERIRPYIEPLMSAGAWISQKFSGVFGGDGSAKSVIGSGTAALQRVSQSLQPSGALVTPLAPTLPGVGAAGGSGALIQQAAANNRTQLDGALVVKFDNAPQGMRVDPAKTNQPGLSITPKVGYRSLGGGSNE
jgi:TP901 family phage tail tape measure protein